MTDIDSVVARALDDVAPVVSEAGDWRSVVSDAGVSRSDEGSRSAQKSRRWMLALATAATAMLGLIIVPTLAGRGYFWLPDASSAPRATSETVVVTAGKDRSGNDWILTAYQSGAKDVCYFLATSGTTSAAGCSSGTPIGTLVAPTRDPSDSVLVLGPVMAEASRVAVVTGDGALEAGVFEVPEGLQGAGVKFYVAEVPLSAAQLALAIHAFDAEGRLIASLERP